MKFCKDCRHFRPPAVNPVGAYIGVHSMIPALCFHPELTSMVTGEIKPRSCEFLRGNDDLCGQTAQWFELKE